MSSNIPNGSMTADPVFIANVKLAGEEITLLCKYIEGAVIPPDKLARRIQERVAQLNAELDGVGASAPGVNR